MPATMPPSPCPGRLTLPPRPGTLTAARLKVTTRLNAAETSMSYRRKLHGVHASHMTMGHAFGVSDERVRSTRRRYAETWPIFCSKAQRGGDHDRCEGAPENDHAND